MAGTFDGFSDLAWKFFAELFPPEPAKRGCGMPHTPFRQVVNTLLYVLSTGCRWCDLPRGPPWASKSAAHRWLQRWLAEERGLIPWPYGAVDGSFSPWERRR